MKTLLLPFASAILLACSLTSCVPLDDPYFAGGGGYSGSTTTRHYTDYGSSSRYYDNGADYGSSYGRSYGGYDSGSRYYDSRPRSSYSSGLGYSTGYGYSSNSRVCNTCHHNPCTCSHHSGAAHHDDDDHRHSSSSSNDNKYHYSGSVGRGDTKPEGNHTREWYKEHGYSLHNLRPSN